MSEHDRMDRARRIREMREGRRTDDDGPDGDESADVDESADGDESADADPAVDDSAGDGGSVAADTSGAESAAADGEDGKGATDGAGDAMADVDEAVADAVERVSSASASLPDTGGIEADPERAGDVAPADQAVAPAAAEPAEAAGDHPDEAAVGAAARTGHAQADTEPETRVLEFTLDGEQYCLEIDYIEEIVEHEGITRVPNTQPFIEGVVDLRGQITTILNPKVVIDTEDQSRGDLVLVFDSEAFEEQGHLGWVVDDVRQVAPVRDEEVNDPPVEGDHIEAVIDRGDDDEDFVVWTTPEFTLEQAT